MAVILLIEDNSDLRENTAELLELKGYDVITAIHGKEGLAIALRQIPDLIICDVRMPELDGFGVLEAVRSDNSTKEIPFIFCTASAQRSEIEAGLVAGAVSYVTKPFNEEDLYLEIERLLGE